MEILIFVVEISFSPMGVVSLVCLSLSIENCYSLVEVQDYQHEGIEN